MLQKQIEGGAPCDVFASASAVQVDALVAQGLISADSTETFASNDLVIIVPASNPAGVSAPADLAKATKLVTGNPETAAHGTKAKEFLTGLGTWDALQPKFVFAENAAQTVDYVARGEVDAGLVFASEVTGNDAVKVVYTVPKGAIKPVRYVAAPIKATTQPAPRREVRRLPAHTRGAEGPHRQRIQASPRQVASADPPRGTNDRTRRHSLPPAPVASGRAAGDRGCRGRRAAARLPSGDA